MNDEEMRKFLESTHKEREKISKELDIVAKKVCTAQEIKDPEKRIEEAIRLRIKLVELTRKLQELTYRNTAALEKSLEDKQKNSVWKIAGQAVIGFVVVIMGILIINTIFNL